MGYAFTSKLKLSKPDAGSCNWQYDWWRNHDIIDIMDAQDAADNLVVSGCEITITGGLGVTLDAGVVSVAGTEHIVTGGVVPVTAKTVDREQYNIIYVDDSGDLLVYPAAPMPAGNFALLYIADADAVEVVRTGDLRRFVNANFPSVKNDCINGTFDIWQRGTSQTSSGYGSDDRFTNLHSVSTKTHTRESFTEGQTNVPNNPRYYSRTISLTGSTSSSYVQKKHNVLDVTKYSGKKVAVSFYAKADSVKDIAFSALQGFGAGGSPPLLVGVETISLTTSWQKFILFFDFPNVSGKTFGTLHHNRFQFWFDAGSDFNSATNSLGNQSGTFDISELKIYESSEAKEFPVFRKDSVGTLDDCLTYCELITILNDYSNDASLATVLRKAYSFNKKKLTDSPSASAVGGFKYWQGGTPTVFTPTLITNKTMFTLHGVGLTAARGFYSGVVLIEDEIS